MFAISFVCKPVVKFFIKNPLIGALVLILLYLYVARKCLLSAWEHQYSKTPTNDEMAARWQKQQLVQMHRDSQ